MCARVWICMRCCWGEGELFCSAWRCDEGSRYSGRPPCSFRSRSQARNELLVAFPHWAFRPRKKERESAEVQRKPKSSKYRDGPASVSSATSPVTVLDPWSVLAQQVSALTSFNSWHWLHRNSKVPRLHPRLHAAAHWKGAVSMKISRA